MKLKSVLYIDAPPSVVWTATEDVERWPEWTPTVKSVRRIDQGPFEKGSSARLKLPALPESTWTVTALTPRERFTWESRVVGIRMIATHKMRAADAGTESVVRIEMTGPVATLLWPVLWRTLRHRLEQENLGLKDRCEREAARA